MTGSSQADNDSRQQKSSLSNPVVIAAIVAALSAVLVAAIQVIGTSAGGAGVSPNESPPTSGMPQETSTFPSASPSTSPTLTTENSPETTGSESGSDLPVEPETAGPAPTQIEITDPVTSHCNSWGGIKWDEGQDRVGSTTVTDAVTCFIYTYRQDVKSEKWSSWEYLLEGDASRISGIIGISNESEKTDVTMRYEVTDLVNNKVLQKGVAKYGTPVKIDAGVKGVTRIRFRGRLNDTEQEASIGLVVGDLVLS